MNRNIFHTEVFVEELARCGLRHVCLSPGSRNTPLVLAFAKHPRIQVSSHLDERSAGFFALGLAMATRQAVAVVCTSGSAAANYFPAVVEASQSRVPLLVLTADRPPELRYSGANQTIDQPKIYGNYALWSVEIPSPDAAPAALSVRHVKAVAARAMSIATGAPSGVVHINLPFRPPLEPTEVKGDVLITPADALGQPDQPYVSMITSGPGPAEAELVESLAALITQHPKGAIVGGVDWTCDDTLAEAIEKLSQASGYPIFSDALSGLRSGPARSLGAFETYFSGKHPLPFPEVVVRIGNVPTSKWLNDWLDKARPKHVIHLSQDGVWADDQYRVSHFVHANRRATALALAAKLGQYPPPSSAWREQFERAERIAWQCFAQATAGVTPSGEWFDAVVAHDVAALLPDGATLFAGNSLPVRHIDQFAQPNPKRLRIIANRGASGIDGNVSTALGLAHADPSRPLALLIGDVTMYHDMNGLLAVRRCGVPITIVLLNNNGGGIFRRLPIKDFEPEFTQHFITPHDLDFAQVAKLYSLEYANPSTRAEFQAVFTQSVNQRKAMLIEVKTDSRQDLRLRQAIVNEVLRQCYING